MHRWAGVSLTLVACLLLLTPLANGAQVDPLWIGGIYDAGDEDDSVLAAISAVAALDGPGKARAGPPEPASMAGALPGFIPLETPQLEPSQDRGPPSA